MNKNPNEKEVLQLIFERKMVNFNPFKFKMLEHNYGYSTDKPHKDNILNQVYESFLQIKKNSMKLLGNPSLNGGIAVE